MICENQVIKIQATVDDLEEIRQYLLAQSAVQKLSEDAAYNLLLAVTELATNSMLHGYKGQPGYLEVCMEEVNGSLLVRLRDHAPYFDPTKAPMPDLSAPLEKRKLGGLGIYLTRKMVEAMSYRPLPEGGNETTLVVKKI